MNKNELLFPTSRSTFPVKKVMLSLLISLLCSHKSLAVGPEKTDSSDDSPHQSAPLRGEKLETKEFLDRRKDSINDNSSRSSSSSNPKSYGSDSPLGFSLDLEQGNKNSKLKGLIDDALSDRHSQALAMQSKIYWSNRWSNLHDFIKALNMIADLAGGSVVGITGMVEYRKEDSSSHTIDLSQMIFGTTIAVLRGTDYFLSEKLRHSEKAKNDYTEYKKVSVKDAISMIGTSEFTEQEIELAITKYFSTPKGQVQKWIKSKE